MVSGEKDDNVKRAILAGAYDVLIKPVSPGKMLERVAHTAANRTPFIVTTEQDVGLIRKITAAFKMAMKTPEPDGQPDALELS